MHTLFTAHGLLLSPDSNTVDPFPAHCSGDTRNCNRRKDTLYACAEPFAGDRRVELLLLELQELLKPWRLSMRPRAVRRKRLGRGEDALVKGAIPTVPQ